MEELSIIGLILFLLNGYVTYMGFRDYSYLDRYKFEVDKVLIDKQYHRLLTAGFLHVNWIHFIFNMLALMAFSQQIEEHLGIFSYLLIYFASLMGGNLLALWIHRNHGSYTAIGASGAISGVIFSYIILFPQNSIGFILLPPELSFKSWIFGVLFVLISIWGIKKQADNIGHEAHIGGAIIGVLITILMRPEIAIEHWWLVLLILLPFSLFMLLIIRNPAILLIEDYWGNTPKKTKLSNNIRQSKKPTMKVPKFSGKAISQAPGKDQELDKLLDKISKVGLENLSRQERKRLDELSK